MHTQADPARIEEVLGYRPAVSFEDGLQRTVEYLLEQFAAAR